MSDHDRQERHEDGDARQKSVVWTVILVALGATSWAAWYVISTVRNPFDGPEAAYLIRPLLIALILLLPLVIWSAIGKRGVALAPPEHSSLWRQPKQIAFIVGLPLLGLSIWGLGFILSAVLYVPVMTWLLGERRLLIIGGLTIGLVAIMVVGFQWGLSVRLPLWPGWV